MLNVRFTEMFYYSLSKKEGGKPIRAGGKVIKLPPPPERLISDFKLIR